MTLKWLSSYAPVDEEFDNVSLLLHGDGTNGSTTIVDSSSSPKAVTAVGDAQISTAQSKFGGSSIAFDGNGDYLTSSTNLGYEVLGGNFTIELWARLAAAQNDMSLVSTYLFVSPSIDSGWFLRFTPTGLRFFVGSNTSGDANDVLINRSFSFAQNQWYHIAVTSLSNVGRIFIDGTQQGATFSIATGVNSGQSLLVGAINASGAPSLFFNGYIDDLRITKGVARYTQNFTPPTAPFPDLSPTTRLTA